MYLRCSRVGCRGQVAAPRFMGRLDSMLYEAVHPGSKITAVRNRQPDSLSVELCQIEFMLIFRFSPFCEKY